MAVVPPFAAGVRLVPPSADARLARPAIVEENGELARLGPLDRRLPFVGPQTAAADVVLDDVGRVLALDILDLAVDDDVLLLVGRLDADQDNVGRLGDDGAEAHRG